MSTLRFKNGGIGSVSHCNIQDAHTLILGAFIFSKPYTD